MAARVELPLGPYLLQCLSFFCSGRLGGIRRSQGVPTMKVKEENRSFKVISVAATWIIRKGEKSEIIELHKF